MERLVKGRDPETVMKAMKEEIDYAANLQYEDEIHPLGGPWPDRHYRELVPPSDPRFEVISITGSMCGAPCFKGSRVPVQILWDHLEAGDSIEVFLEDFEGVTREQVLAVLSMAKERLLDGLPQS